MQRVLPRSQLKEATYSVTTEETLDRELLEICLVDNGYERSHLVEERGQFSTRGDILDLFVASHPHPVRLEFFGDQIESIRHFDITSQISFEEIDRVDILPVRELCVTSDQFDQGMDRVIEQARQLELSRTHLNEVVEKLRTLKMFPGVEWLAPFFHPEMETLANYLPENALTVMDHPEGLRDKAESYHGLILEEYDRNLSAGHLGPLPEQLFLDPETFLETYNARPGMTLDELKLASDSGRKAIDMSVRQVPAHHQHFDGFCATARRWQEEGMEMVIVAPTKGHVQRINELLLDKELELKVESGHISSGFMLPESRKLFIAEHEIFGRSHKRRRRQRHKSYTAQKGFQDLKPGDLLVHTDYGIGQYVRTRELQTGVGGGEFVEIVYADDQKLYVPMDGLGVLQKYVGSGDHDPPLSKMGGIAWKRQKKKVEESIRKMAEDLVKVYARRQLAQGHAFSTDAVMSQEFADAFEFVETDDQLKAIDDVLEDLGKDKPMDRLICGDVGYGKTEVAMRAAFQVVLEKRQVAVLVPTTILAQQHLQTFRDRFKEWPVSVDMVSRFRSAAEQKETLKKLKEGKLDVIIGTHRVLSKDVVFKNLGLVIIDEEQRFGVKHKEKLKELRSSVDILTLSATPIPRTLHFSMMGVRDLSVIETPPCDRLAIKTYIRRFDEAVIRDAIRREMDRGGQVYFVHNKVQGIHSVAKLIQEIVPEVRIGIAHGQLQERMLEVVMKQFLEKEIDLLLCTSIIESGLDIPSANTIIVNRADQFGLAQLYQLRGRVGRFKHQAYAYLMIPGTKAITPDARKRLFAVEEMSGLGAGFQLATRDMEIRGTGNMLGKNQSGHIAAIGFDLYCQMMDETIREMKGEQIEARIEPEIDLQVKGYIPNDYIPEINQRLEAYRRLQVIMDKDELESMKKEFTDRYGPIPEPVEKLLALVAIRRLCQRLHLKKLRLIDGRVIMDIDPATRMDAGQLTAVLNARLKFVSEYQLVLTFHPDSWREVIDGVIETLEDMAETLQLNGDDNE